MDKHNGTPSNCNCGRKAVTVTRRWNAATQTFVYVPVCEGHA